MIKTGPILHSTHVWYMHYLQLLNTPSPSNPHILCAGNQRRGTLSFTRMQFFTVEFIILAQLDHFNFSPKYEKHNNLIFLILGAFGYFEVTHDITRYSKAKVFEHIGKKTPLLIRFSTVGM